MALSVSTPKHLYAIGLLDNDTDSYGMVLFYGRVQRGAVVQTPSPGKSQVLYFAPTWKTLVC